MRNDASRRNKAIPELSSQNRQRHVSLLHEALQCGFEEITGRAFA
jgi:hypothetical protein